MNEPFILRVIDGTKVQMEVPEFVKFAQSLDELGIDCNLETPSPAVLIVTLKPKLQ